MSTIDLVAPCGIDCVNCEIYFSNITDEVKARIAEGLKIPENEVPCRGCRIEGRCRLHSACLTLECTKNKNVDFCYECNDFPCSFLQPLAEGAQKYPHNLKVFNLCRIKNVGIEKFILEEAQLTRKKYYLGKFKIGAGPQI